MSRPLRIDYPNAWYHVMSRGRRAENIFISKNDRATFIELLMESTQIWNIKTGAYCLMPNHYHLLVQTPDANLSKCMRHINGVYAQRFNRSHQYDGPLFRGRYKSILVDANAYLLELMRYIHRNPLQAGLVDELDKYEWSSHRGYLSNAKKWSWLYKDYVLSILTKNKTQQGKIYRKFMAQEASEEINSIFRKRKLPSFLGTESFVGWVKDKFFNEKTHQEVPESKSLAPDREKIKQVVCKTYGVNEENLFKAQRGIFNEPRNVAIYLTRQLRGEGLAEICRDYNLKKYSSVSSVIERVRKRISKDRRFKKRIDLLAAMATKSQTET